MKNLAQLADRIANQMYCDHTTHWEVIRSLVDLKTGGDLDCKLLDILTDMVVKRLKSPRK
jgi:hypothetical protein